MSNKRMCTVIILMILTVISILSFAVYSAHEITQKQYQLKAQVTKKIATEKDKRDTKNKAMIQDYDKPLVIENASVIQTNDGYAVIGKQNGNTVNIEFSNNQKPSVTNNHVKYYKFDKYATLTKSSLHRYIRETNQSNYTNTVKDINAKYEKDAQDLNVSTNSKNVIRILAIGFTYSIIICVVIKYKNN